MVHIDEAYEDESGVGAFRVTTPDGVRLAVQHVEAWLQTPGVPEWVGYMAANQIRTLLEHARASLDDHFRKA